MTGIFVLALILLTHGAEKDVVVPVLAYPSEEICKQKISELEKEFIFKNPALELDCYPWEQFQKEEEKK